MKGNEGIQTLQTMWVWDININTCSEKSQNLETSGQFYMVLLMTHDIIDWAFRIMKSW